ncbi:hypothetical protein AB5I41_01785 [Sphingomonas sp. MMS24-JH45]
MSNASDPGAFFRDMLGRMGEDGEQLRQRRHEAGGVRPRDAGRDRGVAPDAGRVQGYDGTGALRRQPAHTDRRRGAGGAGWSAIEASLARIEAALTAANGGVKAAAKKEAGKDKPTRGRKPAATE